MFSFCIFNDTNAKPFSEQESTETANSCEFKVAF